MAVKTTASGKMDKRTKEYKELKERLAKARAAKTKAIILKEISFESTDTRFNYQNPSV